MNKLLRRLEPWQILTLAAVAWVAALLVVILGLAPLATFLLLPAGETLAAVVSGAVAVGGVIAATLYLPKPFMRAWADRKYDDAMQNLYLLFEESKRNGG